MDLPCTSSSLSVVERPLKCIICDRAAHGFHCGVATCKGCKTFFRRMHLSRTSVECNVNKDCYDLTKRNQPMLRCRACRFQKCILVGMNSNHLVLSNNETVENEKEITKNLESTEILMQRFLENLKHLEQKVEKFRVSAYNPNWMEFQSAEHVLKNTNRLSLADSFGPFPGWPLNTTLKLQHNFFQHFSPTRKHWWFFNLLTIIEYVKTFPFFHTLDLKDQLILVRHVAVGCLNLHICYFTYRKKCQFITQPDGSQHPHRTEPDYPTVATLISPLYRVKVEHEEYLLLKASCVCNAAIPGLSRIAQKILDNERCRYSKTLFDYCLRTRTNGPTRFMELIGILVIVEMNQKKLRDLYILSYGSVLSKLPKQFTISLIEDVFC